MLVIDSADYPLGPDLGATGLNLAYILLNVDYNIITLIVDIKMLQDSHKPYFS